MTRFQRLSGCSRPLPLRPVAAAAALACLVPLGAAAQSADATDSSQIVVTGSRIRGAPPVGAPVTTVGREEVGVAAGVSVETAGA